MKGDGVRCARCIDVGWLCRAAPRAPPSHATAVFANFAWSVPSVLTTRSALAHRGRPEDTWPSTYPSLSEPTPGVPIRRPPLPVPESLLAGHAQRAPSLDATPLLRTAASPSTNGLSPPSLLVPSPAAVVARPTYRNDVLPSSVLTSRHDHVDFGLYPRPVQTLLDVGPPPPSLRHAHAVLLTFRGIASYVPSSPLSARHSLFLLETPIRPQLRPLI